MRAITTCLITAVLAATMVGPASANILHEDIYYWMPDGITLVNPTTGPTDFIVKIQETVWDDPQGRTVVANALAAGTIHGPALPAWDMNLYTYAVTNGSYDDGGGVAGAGITGFNITNPYNIAGVEWGPTASADWWAVANNAVGSNWEWDVNNNQDGNDGDGVGITKGQTHNGFMFAVADGTPHGTAPAWIHSWSGEQPGGTQVGQVGPSGYFVSAPIPVPGAVVLGAVGLGLVGWIGRRRKGA